jgi:hypothetical protein
MLRRLALVVAVVACALAASPLADAAQDIGVTAKPASIRLLRYQTADRQLGLAVSFTGLDGVTQEVLVGFPSTFQNSSAKLPIRYGVPAGTTQYPCAGTEVLVPDGAADLNTSGCMLLLPSGALECLVQAVQKAVPDFGGAVADADFDIYVSVRPTTTAATAHVFPNATTSVDVSNTFTYTVPGLPNALTTPYTAILQAYPRWSKFHSGTLKKSAKKHFPVLFGSLTYAGVGVYGPGNRYGAPTNSFGRNIYIDTLDSDYGPGWRRIMGVLTQPANGTYCYEFSKKGGSGGKTGVSKSNTYRLTAIGPSLTPVVRVEFHGPTFPFGNADYNPLTDRWGTNLSPEQTAALQLQATLMGSKWADSVKGTDCAQTLRQLPASLFAPPST